MGLFPENEIAILQEYVPDGLRDLMAAIRESLDASSIRVTGTIIGPNADLAGQILGQRAQLREFLGHPSFDATLGALRDVATFVSGRDFDHARDTVEQFAALVAVGRIFSLDRALETSSVFFRERLLNTTFSVSRTLNGYGGPQPDAAQRSAILGWSSFLSKDAEHRFRLGLLRAEVLAGRHDRDAALQEYAGLLAAPGLSDAQRKFVALRAGTATAAS